MDDRADHRDRRQTHRRLQRPPRPRQRWKTRSAFGARLIHRWGLAVFLGTLILGGQAAVASWAITGQIGFEADRIPEQEQTNLSRPFGLLKWESQHEPESVLLPTQTALEVRGWSNFAHEESFSQDEYRVDLREATLSWLFGPTQLIVGWQSFFWGENFNARPIDVVNPRDYSEYLFTNPSWSRLPVGMIRLETEIDAFSWQVIYTPVPVNDRLPSRLEGVVVGAAPPMTVELDPLDEPKPFVDAEYGTRLGYRFDNGPELKTYFLRHFNRVPVLRADPSTGALFVEPPVMVNTYGATGNLDVGDGWIARVDVGYDDQAATSAPNLGEPLAVNPVNWVIGIDKTDFTGSLGVQYQYNSDPLGAGALDWLVLFGSQSFFRDKVIFEWQLLQGLGNNDQRFHAKAIWKFLLNWDASIEGEAINGRGGGFFDFYEDRDRVMARLVHYF